LSDVSIQIRRGEIHCLCGENGAGKSTLIKILSGVYPWGSYEGRILYDGKELKLGAVRLAAIQEGIAVVYQELTLVPDMTVGENVYLGKEPVERGSINWDKIYADTQQLLTTYRLDIYPQSIVRQLGVGKMQMTEIAKSAVRKCASPDPRRADQRAHRSRDRKAHGDPADTQRARGDVHLYQPQGRRVFPHRRFDHGLARWQGCDHPAGASLNVEKLVSYMVGREMKERFPKGNRKPGEVIFEVQDLHALDPDQSDREVLKGVSFDLRKGEILGIAGLMGSGRTELVMTLFGEYAKITQGKVKLDGRELQPHSSRQAMLEGLSLVPEDRKRHGLVLIQSVLKNISLPTWINSPPGSGLTTPPNSTLACDLPRASRSKRPTSMSSAIHCRVAISKRSSSPNG